MMHANPDDAIAVRHRVVLLVLLGLMVFTPFLGLRDLWYADEPDIGEVCKAMYESGDWVAPRRVGEIWVDYPPMLYWTGTVSSHVFGGVSEYSLRFANAITAILLIVVTCVAVSKWLGPRAGLWAGLTLMTMQQYMVQAVEYRPDVLFALFIAAGFFAYAEGSEGRGRLWLRVLAFVLFGLAMLSKGPLGVLLPGLVLTLWLATQRRWLRILEMAPLALVSLAVYLPWFVACAHAMGADSILYELYAQNFARFVGGGRGHAQPLLYYVTNFWGDLFPWSLLTPVAVVWLVRSGRWRETRTQLALWWIGTFIVFLSLAVTKRQVYLLPAYPAVAWLVAAWISDQGQERPSRTVRVFATAVATVFALLAAVSFVAFFAVERILPKVDLNTLEAEAALALRVPLGWFGVTLVGAIVLIFVAWKKPSRIVLARVTAAMMIVFTVLFAVVLPPYNPARTYRPQSEWIRAYIGDETHFGIYHPEGNLGFRKKGGFAYYSDRLVTVLYDEAEVDAFFANHPGSVVLVEVEAAGELFAGREESWRARIVRDLSAAGWTYHVVENLPARSAAEDGFS
jgi:4-amino-4-deoxy-L-arabinose transferase-like glycosyltransferase